MNNILVINTEFHVYAEASQLLNNNVRRVNFIICDDKPNVNGDGIRGENLQMLATSALYMPIKMAQGDVSFGHADATPLGVITEVRIKETEAGMQLGGEGVLWINERPADVAFLTALAVKGAYLSWEIAYSDVEYDADGIRWFINPSLLAVTVVKDPAYQERTPIVVASTEVPATGAPAENVPIEETNTPQEAPSLENSANPELLEELEKLREFKAAVEAQERLAAQVKAIKDTLQDAVTEEQARILAGLTAEQLDVIKVLVASKRVVGASNVTIPEFPVVTPDNPKVILMDYLAKLGGSNNANKQVP